MPLFLYLFLCIDTNSGKPVLADGQTQTLDRLRIDPVDNTYASGAHAPAAGKPAGQRPAQLVDLSGLYLLQCNTKEHAGPGLTDGLKFSNLPSQPPSTEAFMAYGALAQTGRRIGRIKTLSSTPR